MLSWCCGSVSCVLCEQYAVQNEPGCGCALRDLQRESVLMLILDHSMNICVFVGVLIK